MNVPVRAQVPRLVSGAVRTTSVAFGAGLPVPVAKTSNRSCRSAAVTVSSSVTPTVPSP